MRQKCRKHSTSHPCFYAGFKPGRERHWRCDMTTLYLLLITQCPTFCNSCFVCHLLPLLLFLHNFSNWWRSHCATRHVKCGGVTVWKCKSWKGVRRVDAQRRGHAHWELYWARKTYCKCFIQFFLLLLLIYPLQSHLLPSPCLQSPELDKCNFERGQQISANSCQLSCQTEG